MCGTDLVLSTDQVQAFPTILQGLRKAQGIFDSIHSFEDVERVFLKGAGLSANTYRAYLAGVRQFYAFTRGKHPLTVTPGDIEAWYDEMTKRGADRATARLRVAGLKRFFEGVRQVVPIYTSPFELMGEKLIAKLNRSKKGRQTKKALRQEEVRALLAFMDQNKTVRGLEDRAAIFMLVSSGLRAFELCGLRWADIDQVEGRPVARFTGKGDKLAEQELWPDALDAARLYFRAHFGRDPRPEDHLFWTQPVVAGRVPRPMTAHVLWGRVASVHAAACEAGILNREVQFSPHIFRRTYATLLYASGMKLKAIQEQTRHASIQTLTSHYIDDREAAAPYLDKIFGRS